MVVIFRLLVQDVLSGSSFYARFRSRGMLVNARWGFIMGFGPKVKHFCMLFLSLSLWTESVLPLPSLEVHLSSLFSSINPFNHQVDEDAAC